MYFFLIIENFTDKLIELGEGEYTSVTIHVLLRS